MNESVATLQKWPGFSKYELVQLGKLPWQTGTLSSRPVKPVAFFLNQGTLLENECPRSDRDTLFGVLPLHRQPAREYQNLENAEITWIETELLARFLINHRAALRAYAGRLQPGSVTVKIEERLICGIAGEGSISKTLSIAEDFSARGFDVIILELQKNGTTFEVDAGLASLCPITESVDPEKPSALTLRKNITLYNGNFLSTHNMSSSDFAYFLEKTNTQNSVWLCHFGDTFSELIEECTVCVHTSEIPQNKENYLLPPLMTGSHFKEIADFFARRESLWVSDFAGNEAQLEKVHPTSSSRPLRVLEGFSAIAVSFLQQKTKWQWEKFRPVYPSKGFFDAKTLLKNIPKIEKSWLWQVILPGQVYGSGQGGWILPGNHRIPAAIAPHLFLNVFLQISDRLSHDWSTSFRKGFNARWCLNANIFLENSERRNLPLWLRPFWK